MTGRNTFWRGKTVLITGHTGFKGAWLSAWLLALGANLHGLSRDVPTTPSAWALTHLDEDVATTWGDIRDASVVRATFLRVDPEVVVHMAAQPFVRRSYSEPVETFETNVLGTVNVLEAARASEHLRVVVNVTSDKCYRNEPALMPFGEGAPMGGADPYSASKGCAELVAESYARSFFAASETSLVSARAGNVIGGGDWGEDRLVPDLMRAAVTGTPVRLRDPAATRPWQHVLNPLSGYLTLAERAWVDPSIGGGWNFGPAEAQSASVGQVAEAVAAIWGGAPLFALPVGDHPDDPAEATTLSIDSSKAREQLAWESRWDLDASILHTTEWYRHVAQGGSARDVTLSQIQSFIDSPAVATRRRS